MIDVRVDRAAYEMSRAAEFDKCVVNDRLDQAVTQTHNLIEAFAR